MITKLELIEYLKHTPENTNYNILYSSLYNGSNKEAVDEFIEVLSRGNLSLAALQPYLAKLYEDDKTISPEPLPPLSICDGVQSDWSQNDPSAKDYVRNRPGGYDVIETRKILETTLVSADDDNNIIADADFFLAEGDSVYVSIDGAPEVTHKVSVTTSTGGGPAALYSFGSKSYDEILAGGFAATDYIVMWYGDGAKWVYMKGAGADLVGKTIVARADVTTPVKIPGKYLEFVINATLDSSRQCALDKTFAQIREAVRAGNKPVVHFVMPDATGTAVMPLVEDYGVIFIFRVTISIDAGSETAIGQYIISINRDDKVFFATSSGLALNSDGNLTQQTMDRDPKQPMQIATKKYVDDALAAIVDGTEVSY